MSETTLVEWKSRVHSKGFNISRMINKFNKTQRQRKATYTVPEEVLIEVCKEYLKRGPAVKDSWPYFMKVLVLKAHENNANNQIEESNKNNFSRTMPQHLSDILNPRR